MAPDLNSVPPSPRPLAASTISRRASQQMTAPTIPPTSPFMNVLPSNQSAVNQTSAPLASPQATMALSTSAGAPVGDNTGVGTGPGPLRHPRPLTAADLHLQLEKEQEAVVNRLTRELSMLRAAQNASVVSNASSTSAGGLPDAADHNANHLLSGPSHPAPSQRRHHRSSSSTSSRSITTNNTVGGIAGSISSGITASSTADRTRSSIPRHDSIPQPLSRQNSESRRSGTSSPASHPVSAHSEHYAHFYQARPSLSHQREPSSGNLQTLAGEREATTGTAQHRSDSITSVQTSGRYEETLLHRHELEVVKRENEALKRKIRELELTLRMRRQSDASRTRSESVSTTASVSGVGRGREREKEGEEDVRVGESARSAGVLRS